MSKPLVGEYCYVYRNRPDLSHHLVTIGWQGCRVGCHFSSASPYLHLRDKKLACHGIIQKYISHLKKR